MIDYVALVRRTWILVVVAPLLGALLGFGLSKAITPTYQAQAAMSVNVYTVGSITSAVTPQQAMNALAKVATSAPVLQLAAEQSGADLTAQDLVDRVTAQVPPNTTTLLVTASASDPDTAARIANTTATSAAERISAQGSQEFTVDTRRDGNQSKAQVLVEATIVSEAVAPVTPVAPRTTMNVLLGAILGLLVGVGIAAWRESAHPRVRDERHVEALLAGSAPFVGSIARRDLPPTVSVPGDLDPAVRNRLDVLRTTLLAQNDVPGPACVTVTGKPAVSAPLAAGLATTFSSEGRRAGLTGLAAASAVPPAQFVAGMKETSDWSFVDTGSLSEAALPVLLATAADGVVVAVEPGRTTIERFRSDVSALQRSGARVLGVALVT